MSCEGGTDRYVQTGLFEASRSNIGAALVLNNVPHRYWAKFQAQPFVIMRHDLDWWIPSV